MPAAAAAAAFGLFDTLVPVSSILTVATVVGHTLPRREHFGLFLLLWWAAAVVLSLNHETFFFSSHHKQWSSSSSSSSSSAPRDGDHNNNNDAYGMALLLGFPATMLAVLHLWWLRSSSSGNRSGKGNGNGGASSLQTYILGGEVPLWCLLALHTYRLDGLSVVVPFWNGNVPKFIGFQTVLLDVIVGAAAVPLTIACYMHRGDLKRLFGKHRWVKEVLWFWNSIGLYDLCSAYLVLVLNYFHLGGQYITDPPLTVLGVHPFPLLVLFQAPIAIAIHVLLLTRLDDLIERQSDALPVYLRRLRDRR